MRVFASAPDRGPEVAFVDEDVAEESVPAACVCDGDSVRQIDKEFDDRFEGRFYVRSVCFTYCQCRPPI